MESFKISSFVNLDVIFLSICLFNLIEVINLGFRFLTILVRFEFLFSKHSIE